MKKYDLIIFTVVIFLVEACGPSYNPEITSSDLRHKLDIIAGADFKGRYPGTPEDSVLLHYIAKQFKSYGLDVFNQDGIQEFTFVSSIIAGSNNQFIYKGKSYISGVDFTPASFSSSGKITAPVVFAGYGFNFSSDSLIRNDYKSVDPQGKWVILLRGNPENRIQQNPYASFEGDRYKAMVAKDKGAAGVILVNSSGFDPMDNLSELKGDQTDVGIPCIQIKRNVADILFSEKALSTEILEKKLINPGSTYSFDLQSDLTGETEVIYEKAKSGNVIAFLRGSDPSRDEYIVIGAHHDHLGLGGQGSSTRRPDTLAIHYGADDNASGVAAVLELAEKFTILKPERNIIFVTFGAEERGIIGSRYFTENPPVPLNKIMMMINMDMIGRMRPDSSLQVGGVGTADVLSEILTSLNAPYKFNLSLNSAGYGPSDHASFYAKDKPVLFFTTGVHMDYHTPDDIVDSLNIDALSSITSYIADVALRFSDLDSTLKFSEAGPKTIESRGYRGKVTLGIMPDVAAEGHKGVLVLAVTEGRPAAQAGIKRGDAITSIDGKPVGDIYEYMFRLGQLKAGDAIIVTVNRNNETIDLLVQL
jgi:aminopeptidase YwaD